MSLIFKTRRYSGGIMAGRPPTKDAPAFGARVAAARKARGLTQAQLAELVGVTQKMIDYYERRAVNVKTDVVKGLAEALSISADELLGVELPKPKRGRRSKLAMQLEQIEQLPAADQELVRQLLNRFLSETKA